MNAALSNLWKKRQQHCFVLPLVVRHYLKDGILYFHSIVNKGPVQVLKRQVKRKKKHYLASVRFF